MTDDDDVSLDEQLLRKHLDETDYEIFKALNEDGRMSDAELADRVGLSRTAVRRRRQKLHDEGIIDILAVIVLQEADFAYADVRVTLSSHASDGDRDALIRRLIDADLVYSLDSCLGEYDLFVRLWHGSLEELKSYVWDLLDGNAAVEEYEIVPIIKTWKAWDRELETPTED